uniref:MADF domain-containing protein n=1 Tax=Sparus aurata TaxID=8175 RepID=A0A671U0P1_SPAAU
MEYKLIMAVSGFPSLYDSNSVTYRDLNMRSEAWRQVALIVGVPESECRRKWKMLRDQHRRERQREKERRESGVGLFNYRPWRYSAILSFLNPFIDARAAGTNGWALNPQPPRFGTSDMVGCSTTTETRSDDDENYGIEVPTDSLLEEYLRRMEAREAQKDRDVDQRDDVTLFLLSLAPAMRRLPAEKQSWVRTKIQQLLHEAEFGPINFQ